MPPVIPSRKPVVVLASVSRQAQIASLTQQLQFSQVELGAQVDLLNVVNDLNIFGQNPVAQAAALTIQPSSTNGGAGSN